MASVDAMYSQVRRCNSIASARPSRRGHTVQRDAPLYELKVRIGIQVGIAPVLRLDGVSSYEKNLSTAAELSRVLQGTPTIRIYR